MRRQPDADEWYRIERVEPARGWLIGHRLLDLRGATKALKDCLGPLPQAREEAGG